MLWASFEDKVVKNTKLRRSLKKVTEKKIDNNVAGRSD
jgi:hypothetical protein